MSLHFVRTSTTHGINMRSSSVWLIVVCAVTVASANSEELLRGKENCLRHDDFPSPNECCSKPQWINRYAVRRCRYIHAEVDGSRYERGSCEARCGLFKINMTMTDRIQRVRVYRPRLQTRGIDQGWINVVLKALSYCKPKVTQLQGRHVRTDEEMEQCEIAEDIFGDCVQAQMFMHCPRATWIESRSCQTMRELLATGCPYKTLGEVVVLNDEGYVRDDRILEEEYDRPYRGRGRTESPRYDYDDNDGYSRGGQYDQRGGNYPRGTERNRNGNGYGAGDDGGYVV
uniref:Putative odorant-binding protein OBPjj17 n=1 Tax=Anopheles gambiae TaxID=7165 RepID=Q6H8Z4_ANOGA|nr:putative odorant-binding protein OBPjj17 [Anopheles gambiae]